MKKTFTRFVAIFALSVVFSTAGAQTVYYVKAGGNGNGTSWNTAAGNIQDMIDRAVAGDEVWVATGTYYPTMQTDANDARSKTFVLKDGVHLYGGFAGNETGINSRAKSDKDGNGTVEAWEFTNKTVLSGKIDGAEDVWMKIVANSYDWTWTISGSGDNCYKVVTCSSEVGDEIVFDGFTVSGGYCWNAKGGAGIYTQGKTIVQKCIITNNNGYGIYNNNASGMIRNCHVLNNGAINTQGIGKGIYNSKGTVSGCTIEGNVAYGGQGVAGYFSSIGGGINNVEGEVSNCKIIGNHARTLYSPLTSSVNARSWGGGVYNSAGKIDRCFIMNNSAYCLNGVSGGAYLSAAAYGGGIYNASGVLSNCCVFNNKVSAESRATGTTNYAFPLGGGIFNTGTSENKGIIYNMTTVNNNRSGNSNVSNYYGSNDISYNSISDASDLSENFVRPTSFIGPASTDQQRNELMQADWRLKEGSEYIDAGSIDNIPDWLLNGTDLAGKPRLTNGKLDLGAYQYDDTYSGIKAFLQANFTVFPNPAADQIKVSGLQGKETLRFYNINGQLLFTRKVTSGTENIPVGHLPSGMYFVKMDDGQTLKWVKK